MTSEPGPSVGELDVPPVLQGQGSIPKANARAALAEQFNALLQSHAAMEAERDALREAARPIVGALNSARRIIGRTDFREVRIEDKTWRPLARLLGIKVRL